MTYKVGDFVESHGLGNDFSKYDQTFNGLKGRVTATNVDDNDSDVRISFFKGQPRKWGEFDVQFVKPMSVLDVVAFECAR